MKAVELTLGRSSATRVAIPRRTALVKCTRHQYGSVEIHKRVNGPDVWLHRWWESTRDVARERVSRSLRFDQYKTEVDALKAAEGMRLIINDGLHSDHR